MSSIFRYVILENDSTDIGWLLQDVEVSNDSNIKLRYQLTSSNLKVIIDSMDTEFDKNALKAVLFTTRSRKDIEDLGIKADRAVKFLRNTISTSEECENALLAAEDMLNIRLTQKKELIDQKIKQIDDKISTLGDCLPKVKKDD